MKDTTSEHKRLKSYVLRTARISKLQRRSYDELLPKYSIPYVENQIEPAAFFPGYESFKAEIGFGMGEATVQIAFNEKKTAFFGIEVHRPGVGKVLSEIETLGLNNLRVINHDAVEVFENMLPDESLEGVHIFFPDPWPKKKHHKRRLVQVPFVEMILPKLKNGGYIYFCTDWEEYAEQILSVCESVDGIRNVYTGYAEPQTWRPRTKFESKGMDKAHQIREVLFRKNT